MSQRVHGLKLASLMLLVAACSSSKKHPTTTADNDAGSSPDSGSPADAGHGHVTPPTKDGSVADGGRSDAGSAQGTCGKLPGKVVYIESGDTQENLLKNVGRHLRDHDDVTIAFNLTGSCTLTNDIYTNANIVPNGTLKYIPSTAEDPSWTPSDPELTCTTGSAGVAIDVAISALFVDSCGLGPTPSGLALIQGPIQAYTFIVPTASDQNAIWAEEAYYAFGFGNANPLAPTYDPWNNESFLFIRPSTKSTLVATAKNIDVPPNKWKGVPEAASTDVVNAVTNSTSPEATIGILGAEVYDANRGKGIKTLAFKAFNQNTAYYPDSSSSTFDKQNLRDGHYTLWSPTVYITKVDGSNTPTNPEVATLMDAVLGKAAAGDGGVGFDGLADVVKVGLIPQCAMQVTRTTDGGDSVACVASRVLHLLLPEQDPWRDGDPDRLHAVHVELGLQWRSV